jgi:hypothetical protein
VLASLEPLPGAAKAAGAALAGCWQELAEFAGAGVVVNNVAIGQQVTGRRDRAKPGRVGSEGGDS